MHARKIVSALLGTLFLLALAADAEETARPVEATAFSGDALHRYEVPAEKRAEVYERIATLEARDEKSEADYETLGYLYIEVGRFRAAIDLYTRGLDAYPESYRLLRHRGHRYINTRQLGKAIVDLRRAVELMGDDASDVLQHRLSGEPFGTYEHWVWYHIGLYHYLEGDYDEAARAYARCVDTATDDATLIGSIDWLYNSYRKAGRVAEAQAILAAVPGEPEVSPGYSYHERTRVYRGEIDPATLLDLDKPGAEWGGREITTGYGVANWYAWNGDPDTAQRIYDAILASPYWSAWAWVVTDREQSR